MLNGTLDYQASDECSRLRDYEDKQAFNREQDERLHPTDYWTDPTPSALAFKDMVGDTTDYALYEDPF